MTNRDLTQPLAESLSRSDEVTVMVFKDGDTSRSFQVSLGWITRLGFALGTAGLAFTLSLFFALKYYRVARKSDPSHVESLEQQLAELKSTNKSLETKVSSLTTAASQANAAAVNAGSGAAKSAAVNPLPVPTVTVTVAAPMPAATMLTPAAAPVASDSGSTPLFSALPKQTQDLTANSSKLPISVGAAHTSWNKGGRSLSVTFNIQYTGTDHSSQQGRIIVLARGPGALYAYPTGVLTKPGSEALIAPAQGEYFSVSRFRETKADFPEIRGSEGAIQDAEILIMSLEGQLLWYQKLPVAPMPSTASARTAKPKTAAVPTPGATEGTPSSASPTAGAPAGDASETKGAAPSKPKSDSSDLIEPGTDQ